MVFFCFRYSILAVVGIKVFMYSRSDFSTNCLNSLARRRTLINRYNGWDVFGFVGWIVPGHAIVFGRYLLVLSGSCWPCVPDTEEIRESLVLRGAKRKKKGLVKVQVGKNRMEKRKTCKRFWFCGDILFSPEWTYSCTRVLYIQLASVVLKTELDCRPGIWVQ